MASSINASLTTGLTTTADTSGILNLQSNGTTVASVSSTGVAVTGNITASGATGGIGYGPAFSAYQSSAQSITLNTWTKIQFQTEEFDTNNNFDSTTNYRFTPTVAGYYQVSILVGNSLSGNTQWTATSLYKNGATFKYGVNALGTANGTYAILNTLVYLNGTTDFIEAYTYLSASSTLINLSQSTYFQAAMVRSA